jgi:hypothetical protein
MTVLSLADAGEAGALAAFLARLLRWDKAAVVRVQAAGPALATFGRPPFGEVLAVRTSSLAEPAAVDATVSAGQLLDAIDEATATATVPDGVTGPSWAGVLPPRSGWQRVVDLDADTVRATAISVVAEFRGRTEALAPEERTRGRLDALAEEIWSRELGGTRLPLRAVHAAHALGFLRPVRAAATSGAPHPRLGGEPIQVALFGSGPWLRLRTPYGSVAVRRGTGLGLSVSPV